MPTVTKPKAFAFDVFGTVVDWRTSIARESALFLTAIGRGDIDSYDFTDAWRFRYIATMADYKDSGRSFVTLDVLHSEMLAATLQAHNIDPASLDEALLRKWNQAWHRLDPWCDSVEGLIRLKVQFPIVTLSNGNVALILDMARHAGLPWDAVLGAEFSGAYKPDPQAYLATAKALAIEPSELCLVASHHSDLAAARAAGLLTAYIDRPMEYGGRPAPDVLAKQNWHWSVASLIELAEIFGC
jgi:2-haloacid dehalogenase